MCCVCVENVCRANSVTTTKIKIIISMPKPNLFGKALICIRHWICLRARWLCVRDKGFGKMPATCLMLHTYIYYFFFGGQTISHSTTSSSSSPTSSSSPLSSLLSSSSTDNFAMCVRVKVKECIRIYKLIMEHLYITEYSRKDLGLHRVSMNGRCVGFIRFSAMWISYLFSRRMCEFIWTVNERRQTIHRHKTYVLSAISTIHNTT